MQKPAWAPRDEPAQPYSALLRAAEELQTQRDEEGIVRVIGSQLADIVPCDLGLSVFMLDPDGLRLRAVNADNLFAAGPPSEPLTLIDAGIGVAVAHTGVARIENDVPRAAVADAAEGRPDARNALAVPLRSREAVLGVLLLYRSPEWPFSPGDLALVQLFANQAAIAVENVRLLERERERADTLEELDRLRSDFLSTISHELRTPLTCIIGFADNLHGYWERIDDAQKLQTLDKIRRSGRRLERFAGDLLLVSHVESGSLSLHVEPVDVAAVVATAVQEIESKYEGEQIAIEAPATATWVLADADRLTQVVVNLLDNAVKYSPEGAPVTLRWAERDDAVALSVRDQGRGIAPDDLSRLFTRFGKIGTTMRAGHVGTGLGLYISRGLVEGMRGRIAVESVPGAGSIFTLTLPAAR